MTGKVVPFEAWHVRELILSNGDDEQFINEPIAQSLAANGNAYTYIVGTEIICCSGVMQFWPGRAQAWAHMGKNAGKHMVRITREVKKFLATYEGRLEMTVVKDFELGHRWAKMLGFEVETPVMKQYGPWGEDHVGYVRIT